MRHYPAIATLVFVSFSGAMAGSYRYTVEREQAVPGSSRQDDAPSAAVDPGGGVGRIAAFPRSSYVWPYASGPYYGDVPESKRRAAGVVHMAVGTFELGSSERLLPAELQASRQPAADGLQYFIVQVDTAATGAAALENMRRTIENAGGVAVVPDLPVTSMIARLDTEAYRAVLGAIDLIGIEPYHPAFKLDPSIGRTPLPDPDKALSEVYELDVMLFPGESSQVVAEKLAGMGGNVKAIYPDLIEVEIHRSLLSRLAALEPVYRVTEHLPILLHAEETTTTVQTGRWNQGATPYHDAGIDGSGNGIAGTGPQVLMILDSGIQLDAADLSDCRTDAGTAGPTHRKVRVYQSTSQFGGMGDLLGCDAPQQGGFTHGHVVAATALGNATNIVGQGACGAYGIGFQAFDLQGNPWRLDGVAPGAKLVAYDGGARISFSILCPDSRQGGSISTGTLYSAPTGGSLGRSYLDHGVKISNFSWGDNTDVRSRVTVEVLDPSDQVVDTETGIDFTRPNPDVLRFVSTAVILSDRTARQPGNGVLDVRSGDRLRVTYQDTSASRQSFSDVDCSLALSFGGITFARFGPDGSFLVHGGCERSARGLFELGFPDQSIDADESLGYRFAFGSLESDDLHNVQASLRCVDVDANSPADCLPNGTGCAPADDPRREDNPSPCTGGGSTPLVEILDSPKSLGLLPAGSAIGANFSLVAASDAVFGALPGGATPKVEMLLEIRADVSGRTTGGLAISRHKLNTDELRTLYSTDFPLGGVAVEVVDRNNNEVAENPTTAIGSFLEDYRFETRTYADMTATGRNRSLGSPWHFDSGNGNFASGLGSITDERTIFDTIAEWGEDKNFNGLLDGVCRSAANVPCYQFGTGDPVCTAATGGFDPICAHIEDRDLINSLFDQSWSTLGGCGWQTRAPGVCSGATARGCHIHRDCLGRCQSNAFSDPTPDSNRACTVNGDCPTLGCSDIRSISCTTSADCQALNAGTCVSLAEVCVGNAGTCGGAGQASGGIWHTGRIAFTALATCMVNGSSAGQCQRTETISGTTGTKTWFELLLTPVMEKVDQGVDGEGEPTRRVEIVNWAWNQSLDLPDNNVAYTYEFDNDRSQHEPVDLIADGTVLALGRGPMGAVSNRGNPALTGGYQVFAPMGTCSNGDVCNADLDCPAGQAPCTSSAFSINGNAGNNRVGRNGCFFEGGVIPVDARVNLGLAGPPDDDFDNDMDGMIDELVRANGPHRAADLSDWNGPDMRFTTLEDIHSPSEKVSGTFFGAERFLTPFRPRLTNGRPGRTMNGEAPLASSDAAVPGDLGGSGGREGWDPPIG